MSCTCNKGSGLFYYVRKEKIEKPTINGVEQPEEFVDRLDSFALSMVTRTVDYGEGGRLVLLNDFHEEMKEVPEFHPKTRKPTGVYKKERNTYYSEITLSKEDGDRLVKLTNIE